MVTLPGVTHHRARVNGVELHYESAGTGPAVVLCHGVGGNHMSWWQQAPVFSRRYRCITLDQRGFGESHLPPEAAGAEAFADDVAALLEHLGESSAFLVGQSMGGRTVLNFARRHGERLRAMVFSATLANIRTEALDRMRQEVRASLPEDRLEAALASRVWEERPQMGYLFQLIRSRNPARPKKFLWRDNATGARPEEIAGITTPALFIVGEEDRIAPPHAVEEAYRLFPNARLVRVPRAGHSVYFEQPEAFNEAVLKFLEEQG